MFNNFLKINKKDIIFVLLLILFWLSINTGSKYLNIYEISETGLNFYLNFTRAILPYVILFLFIFKHNYFLINLNIKNDLFFLGLFLYGIFQIIGLFFSNVSNYEHYWVVCLFSLIIYFKVILENKNFNLVNIIFIFNILFIFIISIIFSFLALKQNILSYNLLYHSKVFVGQLGGEYFPRSTGISRMALISFYFFSFFYLVNFYKQKKNYIVLFVISFLAFIILILQSRTTVIFFAVSLIAINIFFKFNNYKLRSKFILFSIIIPVLLFSSYPILKNYLINKLDIKTEVLLEDEDKINFIRNDFLLKTTKGEYIPGKELSLFEKISSFSNNRIEAWDLLLQIYFNGNLNDQMKKKLIVIKYEPIIDNADGNLKYFFGFGPQSDRHLMNLKKIEPNSMAKSVMGPFGSHASNIFIYSLICGGFLSFFIFVILNLFILMQILKTIKYRHHLNLENNYVLISSISIILFLLFRGLVENSYGVYGVDLIMLLSAYTVLAGNLKKLNV
ncbi:hypothetical protein [Candidatus Pelagibacter sp. HIMB123]|uniref:hypothetical protein n=1 Tax=Candidatus Pelagibacter sp. HIMB123 TaxID=3415413 RepID=UPI003F86E67A